MMTVIATIGGLLLIMFGSDSDSDSGSGSGSEGMWRIAASMLGGMVSANLLTLVVILAMETKARVSLMRGLRHPDLGSIHSLNL